MIVERNRRNAERYLKAVCSHLPPGIKDTIPHLVVGKNPIETLQELAEKENADLVVLSAHGSTGDFRRPFGSVTLSFITYSTKPLLILQDLYKDRIIHNLVEMKTIEKSGH